MQKREDELNRAFGSGIGRSTNGGDVEAIDTVFFMFGDEQGRVHAKQMIDEVRFKL